MPFFPRRCATMATTSRITTLSIPAMEHWRISASSWGLPRPRDPGHYRNGAESHLRSAPVVSRVAEFAGQSTARLVCLERHGSPVQGRPHNLLDTETSNWAWDPISKSFYWHRFFITSRSQLRQSCGSGTDVNVMKFWLEMGVDGFRLDACRTWWNARAQIVRTCRRPRGSEGIAAKTR